MIVTICTILAHIVLWAMNIIVVGALIIGATGTQRG